MLTVLTAKRTSAKAAKDTAARTVEDEDGEQAEDPQSQLLIEDAMETQEEGDTTGSSSVKDQVRVSVDVHFASHPLQFRAVSARSVAATLDALSRWLRVYSLGSHTDAAKHAIEVLAELARTNETGEKKQKKKALKKRARHEEDEGEEDEEASQEEVEADTGSSSSSIASTSYALLTLLAVREQERVRATESASAAPTSPSVGSPGSRVPQSPAASDLRRSVLTPKAARTPLSAATPSSLFADTDGNSGGLWLQVAKSLLPSLLMCKPGRTPTSSAPSKHQLGVKRGALEYIEYVRIPTPPLASVAPLPLYYARRGLASDLILCNCFFSDPFFFLPP